MIERLKEQILAMHTRCRYIIHNKIVVKIVMLFKKKKRLGMAIIFQKDYHFKSGKY